jgi:hypothetical protein
MTARAIAAAKPRWRQRPCALHHLGRRFSSGRRRARLAAVDVLVGPEQQQHIAGLDRQVATRSRNRLPCREIPSSVTPWR